jgi:nitrate/nitrite-specific signal transduction histidine kinase
LDCQPGQILLCIEDDGRGFDIARVPPGHFGLNIMRERAEAVDANLEVVTGAGQGTQIRVTWRADGEHLTADITAGNTDGG